MALQRRSSLLRSPLTLALAAAMLLPATAFAQDQAATKTDEKAKNLDKVTVTGSLDSADSG